MSFLRRIAYMGLGALLVLALVAGGLVAFAQDDDAEETPAVQDDTVEPSQDEGEDLTTADEAEEDATILPAPRFHNGRTGLGDDDELLAEAIGISVEALEAAEDDAYAAAIERAVAEGLITEAQAEQLQQQGAGRRFPRALDVDKDALLAEALGIPAEQLEAAEAEVRAAKVEAMVEAGVLTQEEADLIAAREAVQGYVDREALAETVQNAYEEAVAEALTDGAITEAQADQLRESLSNFEFRFDGFGGRGFGGGRGHHGGRHHGPGGFFAPDAGTQAPALEGTAGA